MLIGNVEGSVAYVNCLVDDRPAIGSSTRAIGQFESGVYHAVKAA
jgi:hypothetical protein